MGSIPTTGSILHSRSSSEPLYIWNDHPFVERVGGRVGAMNRDWDLGAHVFGPTEDWSLWDWIFHGIVAGLFIGVYIFWVV